MDGCKYMWVSGRTDGWVDGWMHGWLNVCVCVGCLLVVDLLGLWRGVKPVSLYRQWGLWRGLISRKPKLLLTVNQQTHINQTTHPIIRPFSHPHGWVGGVCG